MLCSNCRADNPPQNRFCEHCGTALESRCPKCGAPARTDARFCGACGERLTAPPPLPTESRTEGLARPPNFRPYTPKHLAEKILTARSAIEGERRQVTVLFADLAGFTTLAEQLDPEDVHKIINRCFELITAEVHRFEGTINQYTGDGVMALFGAPIAHEDSPRRAGHAALAIQRALRDLSRELQGKIGGALQMRIGVNTGPVVVGRIGDDLRMDYTAVGDTTNLAARLQQAARPGGVLVSDATQKLIAGFFETLDLGELSVKGHAPVRGFEVLRARGRRARLDVAAERGLTPLVGRGRELSTLLDLFQKTKAGHGQVVLVAGEAGIGKSRLLLEFRRRLAQTAEDATWLEGHCISFGQSIPFLPLTDQLRENFRIEEFDGEPEIIAKIEHGMRRMGELESHIPYIRYLLAVDPGDPAIIAMEASGRRKKIFAAARALCLRGAALQPIVFVFEDLHWIDTSTEEYLAWMLDSVASTPIMLLLTHRLGYTPPFGTRSFQTTLTLDSLSEADALAMAGRVLGTAEFPSELRSALMEKAEGVPLFVEEVTKTLLDLGVLRRENGGYRMVKGIAEVSVPDTIQGIIMARLDRLGEDGKRTVQLASVIGRQFLRRLLERIAGLSGQLEGLLAELKALEIIYEQGLLAEPAYIFKHAVIQDVAYNSLLRERRKALHRDVGDAIEELYADRLAEHYEELAHHFVNGEAWDKAFHYLVLSGDRAKSAYANQLALDLYAKALDVAQRMSPPMAPAKIAQIYQRRGEVCRVATRYTEAIAEYERMLEVARDAGDRSHEGEALADLAFVHLLTFSSEHIPPGRKCAEAAIVIARDTGDQHVLAKSISHLVALVDQVEGNLREADKKLEESLQISRAGSFHDVTAQNLMWLGANANWRAEFPKAIAFERDAEQVARENRDGLNELLALAFRCLAHIGRGQYADGLAAINDGLAKAKERENAFIVGRLTNSLGWFYQEFGDFRRSLEYDRESVDLGQRVKNPNVEISALINLAFDYLNLGDPYRALTLLEETLVRVEKFAFGAHRWRWSIHLRTYLAEALLATTKPEDAMVQVEKALAQARATGSKKYVARCHALRGEIALGARDWGEAATELAKALKIAREIGYPTLVWQSAHLLARAHIGQEKTDRAFETLSLAAETLDTIAARIPEPALNETFIAWSRVRAVRDDLERLRRA